MTEETEIIQRVLQGDTESFALLVHRYQGPVVRMVRNLTGDVQACEDLAQEVFLATFAGLRRFDPARSRFSTWLFTITRNKCINAMKKRRPVPMRQPPQRGSLFEAFRVPAASEYPNIVPDDRILANKTAYRKADPEVGDVVLFRPPTESWRIHYIKRIVALGGETVEIKDGVLYVNDKPLPRRQIGSGSTQIRGQNGSAQTLSGEVFAETNGSETYKIFLTTAPPKTAKDFPKTTVPPHHCFVLGDNRNCSLDSRHFGPIPYAAIEARVDYIYWPVDTWARFGRLH